ncbi:MAG: hypothetical protein K0R38_631 [Polyangiaceae bacterium]|jgi:hypothetical protein|nr:hypothetical protein [Polyangiaceae bacterium]
MTTPISGSNSSVYDRNAQISFAAGSGPATSMAGPTASVAPAAPPLVTIDPVVIEGDAGARQLVQRYDQSRRAADCSDEAKEAGLSCAKAGVAAVVGGLSATTVVGALPAAAITLVESISCGKDLATYFECENP